MMKRENGTAGVNTDDSQAPLIHLIVFKVGSEEYGIKIEQVKEVTITPDIAKMPKTPAFIKGVANIRGDIIAVMDLEERFKVKSVIDNEAVRQTYTLVIEAESYNIGILVKEVPQSITVPVTSIDKTPGLIQEVNINQNFIDGIAKINKRLIIVLDMRKILTVEEVELLQA